MTWNTLTNLATGQTVTEAHMDAIRENIEHLGSMLIGSTALSAITAGSNITMAVGSYTGDGAATKAVTGIGFQPRFVIVFANADPHGAFELSAIKSSSNGTRSWVNGNQYEDDHIISLDSNGFTVGDGTGGTNGNTCNINLSGYTYIAWR